MEESAFERHARQWRLKAVSTSRSYGADEAEAEDVAQDVMLRLWQMHDELDRYRSVEALVVVMARRMTWSLSRPLSRMDTLEVVRHSPPWEGETPTPQEVLEEKENEAWLERRLGQLPPTQRTLLYMRQVERRSHQELSQLLGIELTSVSTLLARARRTLLEEIKQRNK